MITRILDVTREGDSEAESRALTLFVTLFSMHVAAREWIKGIDDDWPMARVVLTSLVTVGFALVWFERTRFLAALLVAVAAVTKFAWLFPDGSNHMFVETTCALVLALAFVPRREPTVDSSAIRALRWLPILVLFWSGVQKMLHGAYFDGSFLAFLGATDERFIRVLEWTLPGEAEHLAAVVETNGPYRFVGVWPVVASNLVYLVEIVAAVMLVVPATRRAGVWVAAATLVGIEIVARELQFGGAFACLLTTFVTGLRRRHVVPVFALYYAMLLAVRLGILPPLDFF